MTNTSQDQPPLQITVPRDSANDDQGVVVGWIRQSGDFVKGGDPICEVEFSKAVIEIAAPGDGYLYPSRAIGEQVPVGAVLGMVLSAPQDAGSVHALAPSMNAQGTSADVSVPVTQKAQALMQAHGLTIADLPAGLDIVRERDVQSALNQRNEQGARQAHPGLDLTSPTRRYAANALTKSWREIPHSHLVRWIDAEAVEARVAAEGRARDMMLSISDWLAWSVAQAAKTDPRPNAYWNDGIEPHAGIHLGFALNQSNGELIVPVIHGADGLALEDFVARIKGLQKTAVRRKLRPEDVTGGSICVT
ncbi:MAG: 2-oxo acid dehydrogenase subunit E2, partial [Rhizobiales bacterium]|nr:2-oxo acid dehydrogenase subunit E2 [Hyphomicrobiales bacterium]